MIFKGISNHVFILMEKGFIKMWLLYFLNMPNVESLVENYPILFHIKQTKQILKTFKLVFWPQRMSSNAAFARHP